MRGIGAWSFLVSLFLVVSQMTAQCDGCQGDDSGWEGTAGGSHLWTYTPGALDTSEECDASTCLYKPCKFTGTVTFTNNGAVAVEVRDPAGNVVSPPGGVPGGGGVWNSPPITVAAPCGQEDEFDPWYGAHPLGGGARQSGYIFSCTRCS